MLTLLLTAAPASALVVLIDFDDFGGTPGAGWNVVTSADSGSTIALVDAGGNPAGIDLQLPSMFDNDGQYDGWLDTNGLPAWAPSEAVEDYVYMATGNGNQWYTFRFTGLDPNITYNIDMVVSRNLSREQTMRLNGDGQPVEIVAYDSLDDGYLPGDQINWPSANPTIDGTLTLRIRRLGQSAAINALRLWAIPEPSPLPLLASAGLMWLLATRGSRRP